MGLWKSFGIVDKHNKESESEMNTHFTRISGNVKTGPMPVTTTSAASCPDSCSLKAGGCYAKGGPLGIHWSLVTQGKRGSTLQALLEDIKKLPKGTIWRHNQAGDLLPMPQDSTKIDGLELLRLVQANKGKKGFTYTHYSMEDSDNALYVSSANALGFTVNASAESLTECDSLLSKGLPVCTLLPEYSAKTTHTPNGALVVTCPAAYRDDVSCFTCGNGAPLCQRAKRDYVIGFPVHGSGKKKANKVFMLKSI